MKINTLKLSKTGKFVRHYRARINKEDDKIFYYVIEKLLNNKPLEPKFKDHKLSGYMTKFRDCHIKNDLVLIYQISDDELRLIDIGTHSQIFK